jgi:hypothetical protein
VQEFAMSYKNLVNARTLLIELFPRNKARSLRWLRYRIAAGDLPSEKIGSARLFDVEKCKRAVKKMQGQTNGAVKRGKK